MLNDLTPLQEKVSDLVRGNKEWEVDFIPGFCRFLDYANTMSQVFLDVDLRMVSKLMEEGEQRDLARDFLTDPNKNYLILVRVYNEEEDDDPGEPLNKPVTSIDEMRSKQNLDEQSRSLATDITNMDSYLVENKHILEQMFFCESIDNLKEMDGDAVLFFKTIELEQKKIMESPDYFDKAVNTYSLGEVGSGFNIYQTLNGCIKNAFMPLFTNVMSVANKFLAENSLVSTVQKNLSEITLEINQRIQTANVTFEKFIHDEKIQEMCQGKTRIEEIQIDQSLYNDINFMNSLHELIRKVLLTSGKA